MPGNEMLLVPGVYTVEVPEGGEPLQPAGSAAYAPIGTAEWGPMNKATLITSWPEFVRTFGNDMTSYLALGVRDFFRMGGQRAWVVRTAHYSDITDLSTITAQKASVILQSDEATPQDAVTVTALYYGTHGNDIKIVVENVDTTNHTFDLVVEEVDGSGKARVVERYTGLVLDSSDADHFAEDVINGKSSYIEVAVSVENVDLAEVTAPLAGGDNGTTSIADADYIGDESTRTGLYALDTVPELLTINHPGITSKQVLIDGVNYVNNSTARRQIDTYIYDLPLGYSPQEALSFIGDNMQSTGYEGVYYPWVKEGNIEKPVTPYVAGVFARNDYLRGVWEAPAGAHFPLPITDVVYDVDWGDMSVLNPHGINSIDHKQFEGFLVWGARTLDVNTHFRYINVRRFVNTIKKTLQDGAVQFVFELNAPATWARIEDTAYRLLMYYHSLGAFAGKTPEESFFAKCDKSTNPPELVDQGIMTVQIGICPVKPAEFVVFDVMLYNEGVLPIATTPQKG